MLWVGTGWVRAKQQRWSGTWSEDQGKEGSEALVYWAVCKLAATTARATFTASESDRRQKQSLRETKRFRDLTLNFGTRCLAGWSGWIKVARRHTLLP